MMHRALNEIIDMPKGEFERRIFQIQRESRTERKMKNTAKRIRKQFKNIQSNERQLRCKKCDRFVCLSLDIRRIKSSHHVNTDKDFYKYADVRVDEYPSQDRNADCSQAGTLLCKKCGEDWGNLAIHKGIPVPVIKIAYFKVVTMDARSTEVFNQWKDVPFTIEAITEMDLEDLSASAERLLSADIKDRLRQE